MKKPDYSSIQIKDEKTKEMLDKYPGKSYEERIWSMKSQKDNEVKNMVEEIKKVFIESTERREYWKDENKAIHVARKAFIKGEVKSPLCGKCFHEDWHAHKVKDWKEYCVSKKVREIEDIERNPKAIKFGQLIGKTYDFVCANKHGTSISLLLAELGEKSEVKG